MTPRQRKTLWQRRRRERLRRAQRGASLVCTNRESPWRACGERLEFRTDAIGRVVATCHRCARRQRGICADCPRRVRGVPGRALRCPECSRRHSREAITAWYARNGDWKRMQGREWKRRREGYYARRGLTPPPIPTIAEWTRIPRNGAALAQRTHPPQERAA